jgi:hypothetical protein
MGTLRNRGRAPDFRYSQVVRGFINAKDTNILRRTISFVE